MKLFRTLRKETQATGENRRRRRSLLPGCIGVGCGLPTLALLILWLVFSLNNRPPNITVPTPQPLSSNALNDFLRAAQMVRGIKHKSPQLMPNPPRDTAGLLKATKACTQDAAPALAVMRQGLSKPCQIPAVRSVSVLMTTVGGQPSLRELARTIYGVAQYYKLSGQPGKAAEVMLDGAEMGVLLPHGGALIDLLLGHACEAICLDQMEAVLPHLSAAELAHFAERLDRIVAKRAPYVDTVLEEGNIMTALTLEALKDPKANGLRAHYETLRSVVSEEKSLRGKWNAGWEMTRAALSDKQAMMRSYQDYFKALAKEAEQPYQGKSSVPVPDNNAAALGDALGVMGRQKYEVYKTKLDLLRIETALYRYRAAQGHYPTNLSPLMPVYLKVVPEDPFTGVAKQMFIYRAENNGNAFHLYSIGTDRVDNGGQAIRHPETGKAGDIVAGIDWNVKKTGR